MCQDKENTTEYGHENDGPFFYHRESSHAPDANYVEIGLQLGRIEHLILMLRKEVKRNMATVKENLDAIMAKADDIAQDVAAEQEDIAAVKQIIQALKDGQTDPALEAQAQAAFDKLSGVEANLKAVETSLSTVANPPAQS